jgi:hypothetical protein
MIETYRQRRRRIRDHGYHYREAPTFYVWNGGLKNPCGHAVESRKTVQKILAANPEFYVTGGGV